MTPSCKFMGKVVHDSETLASGQQVMSACAFIHHDFDGLNKFFLAKQATTKKFLPGKLEMPGGHIDFGEELITGLAREVQEEFAMGITLEIILALSPMKTA